MNDPAGSDHLPMQIKYSNGDSNPVEIPFDVCKNIDWKRIISEELDNSDNMHPSEIYSFLTDKITNAAMRSQTKPAPTEKTVHKPPTLWWDRDCTDIVKVRSQTFKEFKRRGSFDLFIKYREVEAKSKRMFKAKKRGYWKKYVESLSPDTTMSSLWKTARRMRNCDPPPSNVSEYNATWIEQFAQKVCPSFVPGISPEFGNNCLTFNY